ncbi:MAG: ATP synthase F1 subunit delta [Candidatus Brocadiia bacterium]
MKQLRLAKRYARVLLDLASERGAVDEVKADIKSLEGYIANLRPFPAFLSDAKISEDKRSEAMTEATALLRLRPLFAHFCQVLVVRRRFVVFPAIAAMFRKLADLRDGYVRVKVVSAETLSDAEKDALRAGFAAKFNCKPVCEFTVKPELIGGLQVEINNVVYDNSISARLDTMRRKLTGNSQR